MRCGYLIVLFFKAFYLFLEGMIKRSFTLLQSISGNRGYIMGQVPQNNCLEFPTLNTCKRKQIQWIPAGEK